MGGNTVVVLLVRGAPFTAGPSRCGQGGAQQRRTGQGAVEQGVESEYESAGTEPGAEHEGKDILAKGFPCRTCPDPPYLP